VAKIEILADRKIDGLATDIVATILHALKAGLKEVAGFSKFLEYIGLTKTCIASSSSPERLAICLEILGLTDAFAGNVFSAENVLRGKPSPDIFLFAASRMETLPENCIVIEDSVSGVRAAVAANMRVIGLTSASHIRSGHDQRLMAAGATYIAKDYSEVRSLLGSFM
jgi:HAD superfamily hydrolase (TIGR01509 family)